MSNTPHELADDFPAETAKIQALKLQNAHFAKLVTDYHEVNRQVHRAESRVEPLDDAQETALRQRRMRLKDEIWQMLKAA